MLTVNIRKSRYELYMYTHAYETRQESSYNMHHKKDVTVSKKVISFIFTEYKHGDKIIIKNKIINNVDNNNKKDANNKFC